jgi:hypothetical protein
LILAEELLKIITKHFDCDEKEKEKLLFWIKRQQQETSSQPIQPKKAGLFNIFSKK